MDTCFFVGSGIVRVKSQAEEREPVQGADTQAQQLVQNAVIPLQYPDDSPDDRTRIWRIPPVVPSVFAFDRTVLLVNPAEGYDFSAGAASYRMSQIFDSITHSLFLLGDKNAKQKRLLQES